MPDFDYKEKRFEQDIEEYLTTYGGYQKGDSSAFYEIRRWIPVLSFLSSGRASRSSGRSTRRYTAPTARRRLLSAFAGK